ncbi:MAG: hypothetical protein AB7U20_09615 [Planctomycetaceae bacterium]
MTVVKARFDGRVFVPQEPVNLPVGFELEIPISNGVELLPERDDSALCTNGPKAARRSGDTEPGSALRALAELAKQFPCSGLPEDLAAEHDHYLYGTPKRGQ